uniref:phage protein Gp27 family protein n=1 Tax=Actibacterium sp. TaxID=1872125 RepID=UPI003561BF42
MPPPRKVDLIPEELRKWLKEALSSRGFGDIIAVTDELNFKLEAAGLQLNVGKTAVGEFSKLLKDQREAFGIAETLMADMDIDKESEIHKVLMHMIASMAMQLMKATREDDGHLPAKDLMALGKMLKDLMASAGIREKLLDDERQR